MSGERPGTIPALVAGSAERFGERLAVVDGETRLTYAELAEEARTFGAALVGAGVEPGDRVSIWAPNRAEWIVAALGLWQAGAVLVPVNTRFKGGEAADILSRSHARVLVTVADFLDTDYVGMLRAAGVGLPELQTVVVVSGADRAGARASGDTAGGGTARNTTNPAGRSPAAGPGGVAGSGGTVGGTAAGTGLDGPVSWDAFVARASDQGREEVDRRRAAVGSDDVSDILFTSGTTGRPKGVVSTHDRTLRVATDWVDMVGLQPGDRYLMVNPYFHMFGLKAGILTSIAAGVTMLPEAVFDVDRALRRIAEERVTVFPGAPTLYQSILDHPDRGRYDLSSLRAGTIGAADIPVELIRRIFDELPYQVLISGYGLTEAGTATGTAPDDDHETIATTVGRPRPGFELRIVDGDGNDVPAGEAGEILLRGGSVLREYLDDPEATAAALSPDGWLKTGDVGRLTGSGCLQIVGRIKDMFIVGGFNAYPAEIENLLLRHPDIQQAAVIGIPDQRLGEVGMAFVVLRPGATATSGDEIVAWSRDQMANYKVPRVVEIVDELPLNATGKVMKDVLRERAAAAEARPSGTGSPA